MYLLISTTDNSGFSLAVGNAKKVIRKKNINKKYQQSELLLFEIKKILKNKKPLGIIVVNGPGAFSALRIGVATANALAFAWKIKVVGVEKQEDLIDLYQSGILKILKLDKSKKRFIEPLYGGEPNISQA